MILAIRVGDTISLTGCGQGMHFSRGHSKTHPPGPLTSVNCSLASSQQRNRAAERAAGAEHPCPASHRSPERQPLACPGGAAARRPSGLDALEIPGRALEAKRSWGLATLANERAADGASSPAARAGWRMGPSPPVCRQSLAPCGFLGDVAPPPAQASFRLG